MSIEESTAIKPPPSAGSPAFVELTIACPNFSMRYLLTQERVKRVLAFMLKEATEAQAEYEQSLKVKP